MRIIVVGAGSVGEYMVQLALEGGHNVVLIESDEERAEYCAQHYDAQVLQAEIGEEDILDEAGASQATALVATTVDDSINLMTMVLGQEYEIPNLISTVNSRHRKSLFDRLGVNTLVDPEILAARHLLDLTLHSGGETVTSLSGDGMIYELTLAEDAPLAGHTLEAVDEEDALPQGMAVVLVRRGKQRLFLRESTELEAGDALLIYSDQPLSESELSLFTATDDANEDS